MDRVLYQLITVESYHLYFLKDSLASSEPNKASKIEPFCEYIYQKRTVKDLKQ